MNRLYTTALFIILAFCSSVANAQEAGVWKVGLLLCLTGDCAADGDAALKGATLAVEELNANGGVLGKKVVVVVEDTAEAVSGAKTISAYRRLKLDKDIHYIVGPTWTPGGKALAPLVSRESNLIITSPSLGVRDFNEAGKNIFNSRGPDEIASKELARFAIKKGWKTAAIFSSQQPWEEAQGSFFEEEFKRLGGKVLLKLEPLPSISQLHTEALKLVSVKADVIFSSALIRLATIAKELRTLKYEGPKLAVIVDETRLKEAHGALDKTFLVYLAEPEPWFIDKFTKKYPKVPVELPSATSYDTVMMYAKAIESANTFETSAVGKTLLKMEYQGASGAIAFDPKGGALRKPVLKQVVGSEFKSVQ